MIGLMDCNNFFVSCERLFRPDLLKKPVAVLSSNDGCIVARSQEIKDLGIPMGIPYFKVKDICKESGAVLFSSNFTLYRDISARVMQTLSSLVGPCDIYSIDEAFFEVDDAITKEEMLRIRATIMRDVGLPVSIGVSSTKTLAKQASALAKKTDGVCILDKDMWAQKAKSTPASSVWGLGRQTSAKLREMGVSTVAEFLAMDRSVVRRHFGVGGDRIYSELMGVPVHELGYNSEDVQQSIMSTRSFEKTTKKLQELESSVAYHVSFAAEKLREKKLVASKLYVTIQASRHGDFMLRRGSSETILTKPTSDTRELLKEALQQTRMLFDPEVPYKKAGVVLGGLMPESYVTTGLFEEPQDRGSKGLDTVTDMLNERFGAGTIRSGAILQNGARSSAKLRSKEYTTSWKDIPSVRAK
jgi:DNA polymerase V